MVSEIDLTLGDGQRLHVYDTSRPADAEAGLTIVWHHGTPNIGTPPAPLFEVSRRLGIRWVSYDRPGYGGSSPVPDRAVGTAATYTRDVTDRLGIERFAVMGHSGGGPHALACAALLPDRVLAAVSVSGPAPYGADGLDWYAGMAASSEGTLRAAAAGRVTKEAYEAVAHDEPIGFVAADWTSLEGEWGWFESVVKPALAAGPGPVVDDDLALVAPWGCDPADIRAPVLLVHGELDRVIPSTHGVWLAHRCRSAELRLQAEDGHVSVMRSAPDALAWLRERADGR